MSQATNVTPICRVRGLPIGNPACTACGSGGRATIKTLCQIFASEFQDWLNLLDRNRANETLQSVARIILHRVASRLNLAPRLTPEELEAKCKALAASIDEKWEELHRQWQAKAASLEVSERERDALAARVRELEDELKTFVAVHVDRIEKEKMRDMHRRMLSETVAAFTESIDSLHRFYGKRLAELEARNG